MTTPSPSPSTAVPPPSLSCSRCRYRLDGLPTTSLCPECALPISVSIEASERRTSRRLPPPGWFRILRTAWFTTFLGTLSLTELLPHLKTAVRHNLLPDYAGSILLFTLILGVPLFLLAIQLGRNGTALSMFTLVLVGVLWPVPGH